MEQRQSTTPHAALGVGGGAGLEDRVNMFLEKEDEGQEEQQARPVLESKQGSVSTTWVPVRVAVA